MKKILQLKPNRKKSSKMLQRIEKLEEFMWATGVMLYWHGNKRSDTRHEVACPLASFVRLGSHNIFGNESVTTSTYDDIASLNKACEIFACV